jgi:prophage regulatory protein
MHTILRLPQVKARTGRGRSSVYADIRDKLFISPVSIGARAVGWPSGEVDTLIAARIAGKSDAEIRALVAKLEAARKTGFALSGR